MQVVRSVGAVIAGAIVILVLVAILGLVGGVIFGALPDPETKAFREDANIVGLSAWNVLWYFPVTMLGAWLAAVIAGRRPMMHAAVIAALILIGGVVYMLAGADAYEDVAVPPWYLPLLPVTGFLGAMTGGALRARSKRSPAP